MDLELTRDSELMVVHVQAETDAGADFVDSYLPDADARETVVVVDSGRIILHEDDAPAFVEAAQARGLTLQ